MNMKHYVLSIAFVLITGASFAMNIQITNENGQVEEVILVAPRGGIPRSPQRVPVHRNEQDRNLLDAITRLRMSIERNINPEQRTMLDELFYDAQSSRNTEALARLRPLYRRLFNDEPTLNNPHGGLLLSTPAEVHDQGDESEYPSDSDIE